MCFLQYEAICSFSMSISSLSCGIELAFSVILDTEGVKQKKDRGGGGGGDYSRAAIISNILTKRGQSRALINRGTAIIRGLTVFW